VLLPKLSQVVTGVANTLNIEALEWEFNSEKIGYHKQCGDTPPVCIYGGKRTLNQQ